MPMKKFDVILADPPWQYTSKSVAPNREVTNHYSTMPTDDICNLPIEEKAAAHCALFLWATWPLLPDALQVINTWGFTYKTIAWVWVKSKQSGMGFFWGMGGYTRSNSEPCLLAFTKELSVASHSIQSLIYSPVRKHSQKPDDQYRKIEALYPDRNYLELFARRKRQGWSSWGNEVQSDVDLTASNYG